MSRFRPAVTRPTAANPASGASPSAANCDGREDPAAKFVLFNAVPSWLASFLFHIAALIVMGLITFSNAKDDFINSFVSELTKDNHEEIVEVQDPQIEPLAIQPMVNDKPLPPDAVDPPPPDDPVEVPPSPDDSAAPTSVEISPLGEDVAPWHDLLLKGDSFTGSDPFGRGKDGQVAAVRRGDSTQASQDAVARALKWLAEHQLPDGGWSFDHRGGACQGRCRNHGSLAEARNGATGLALLPFLGSGQTHKEGQYKQVVEKGLYFLLRNMKVKGGERGELSEAGGNMYSHGICSIVLCEAYAMTHDKGLMQPAQLAINHIVYAQDPVGGGWRYQPKQPGDTSVVGWQLMALKSAHLAYLRVPPETVKQASKFLDSVQAEYGAHYGYTAPAVGHDGTTAVGLLSRMYLGWKHDHPGIVGGAKYLDGRGPNFGNLYYTYYASQVMRHYDGPEWKRWNGKLRDPLVALQAKAGHEEGSWNMTGGDHGFASGGRLYCTAMATMLLEVPYRHMPIYQKAATKEDFEL